MVTVAVVTTPGPIIEYGDSARLVIAIAGPGMMVAVTETPANPGAVAVIVTGVGTATASAVTGNVTVVPSDGNATLAGSCTAEGVSVDNATVIPPRKAGLFRTMVPVSVSPLDQVW